MRYRITDLLLVVASIAVVLGWSNFFSHELTLDWHERHPIAPVECEIDGQKAVEYRRVLMYYALDEFWTPSEFGWLIAKFYTLIVLQFAVLTAGTVEVVTVAFRRWPKPMWRFTKLLGLLLVLALVLSLVLG